LENPSLPAHVIYMNYFEKQKKLHKQAEKILKDLNLIEVLKKYGVPKIVGSYALELMSWPDIDIVVITEPNYKHYLNLVNYLFEKEDIYSLNLQDFRKSIYPDRPQGIYCGISYIVKPNTFWKIDVWFFPDVKAFDVINEVKSKLTDINRAIILKIKNEMREKIKHGKEISGIDVYKAVLENGVRDLEGFRQYLKKKSYKDQRLLDRPAQQVRAKTID